VDFFINYNKCKKSEYKNFSKNKTKLKFNLSPFIGMGVLNKNAEVNLYSPSRTVTIPSIPQEITYPASNEKVKIDFSNQLSLNFGFEAEIILPFNKNKWSVFASPN